MSDLPNTPSWNALKAESDRLATVRVRDLFADNEERFADYSMEAAGLLLDYSKNKIDERAFSALLALAEEVDIEGARRRMFAGERINTTERRAVLHVALRDFAMRAYHVDDENVSALVQAELDRIKHFVKSVHEGTLTGHTGARLNTVVNIGIGGSDLGPKMAVTALKPYWADGRSTHFVSNVDGQHLAGVLDQVDPARTLFVIASKTFTTQETMTNARSAREWLVAHAGGEDAVAKHFVALSTNEQAVTAFGIAPDNMFRFWDWVGGRYSMWSAIGLSIALQVGYENFEKLLRGAHAMDEHFRSAPLGENTPVLLALIGVWNQNLLGACAHAVLPYDEHLALFPAHLQQVVMESNGKSRLLSGAPTECSTGPILFGEPGTNGQHAFYQLIHQGTDLISADFIAPALSQAPLGDHHEKLLANFLAQTEALMLGQTEEEVREVLEAERRPQDEIDALAAHKIFPGDRPTNAILFEKLTPEILGALVALYEHKVFCHGVLWGVNSFDQWGVELGKTLAKTILPEIAPLKNAVAPATRHDSSTNGLINWINSVRAGSGVAEEDETTS